MAVCPRKRNACDSGGAVQRAPTSLAERGEPSFADDDDAKHRIQDALDIVLKPF